MTDDIPALPNRQRSNEGDLDKYLDVDLGDGTGDEIRRANAGLEGDWEPGSLSLNVNWDDASTYDEWDDGGDWDNAILLEDD